MQTSPNNTIHDNEIDFNSIGSKIASWFVYPVKLLVGNIKTSLVFFLAAILLSVALKFAIKKTYKANFVIRPNERNERTHLKMLEDLQRLLKLKDFKTIATELKLDEPTVESIEDIEFTNFAFSKIKADSSNTTLIELELFEPSNMLLFQNKILSYIENNPYFSKIKAYQEKNIDIKSELVEKDIVLLDSLKRLQIQSYDKLKITEQNSVFLKDLINPTSTYTLSLERLNQKSGLIAQKMFLDNFQLVKGVVVSEKHSWPPRVLLICLVMVPLFMLACVVFLHVRLKSATDSKNDR